MKSLLVAVVLTGASAVADVPESLRAGGALVGEGSYAEALPLLEQAIQDIRAHEPALLPAAMNLLARANQGLGRYAIAEGWYRRAIAEYEAVNRRDPRIAVVLGNLLSVYVEQGFAGPGRQVADRLDRWAPDLLPASPDHRRHVLSILASFRLLTGEEQKAEETLERALAIPGGTDPAQEAAILNCLANLSAQAGRDAEATAYLVRALDALERGVGPDHPSQVQVLQNLAVSYYRERRFGEALTTSRRALSLVERWLPGTHPFHWTVLRGYADLLRKCGQKGEAKRMEARARSVRSQSVDDNSRLLVDVTELKPLPRRASIP